MAITKVKPSRGSLKNIIDYIFNREKTDEKIIAGKDCLPENALYIMNTTKDIYGKTDGRSYYHYIQSFKPGETNADVAHEIGKELAESQFKGYEVAIATHVDKAHLHNHFVVNSVSFEDGRKLHTTMQDFRELKKESDRICRDRGLSVIEKPYDRDHYSMAEYKLAEKGQPIWKEQLRAAIDEAKVNSRNIVEMKDYLEKNFNIDMKIQNKNLSFLHPEKQKYCRGSKLGNAYTKDEIIFYFERKEEIQKFLYITTSDRKLTYAEKINHFRSLVDEKIYDFHDDGGIYYKNGVYFGNVLTNDINPKLLKDFFDIDVKGNEIIKQDKTVLSLSKVGFGIESITHKISRDIEKDKIRVDKAKISKDRAKEKYKGRDRVRDTGRERKRER